MTILTSDVYLTVYFCCLLTLFGYKPNFTYRTKKKVTKMLIKHMRKFISIYEQRQLKLVTNFFLFVVTRRAVCDEQRAEGSMSWFKVLHSLNFDDRGWDGFVDDFAESKASVALLYVRISQFSAKKNLLTSKTQFKLKAIFQSHHHFPLIKANKSPPTHRLHFFNSHPLNLQFLPSLTHKIISHKNPSIIELMGI